MLNPAVTQATIGSTICVVGFTATIRPPSSLTGAIKVAQIRAYGYADTDPANYEEDHVVSLALGGAALAPVNLFPEPEATATGDDGAERALQNQVCDGAVTLADAQAQILALKTAHGYNRDLSASVSGGTTTAAPSSPPAPASGAGGATYYANCAAARAAGVTPLSVGEPGYRSGLDRDGDGVACE